MRRLGTRALGRAIEAIVADTWHQARNQLVFLLLVSSLFLVSLGALGMVKLASTPGQATRLLVYRWQQPETSGLEEQWDQTYADTLAAPQLANRLADSTREIAKTQTELAATLSELARVQRVGVPDPEQASLERRLNEARARLEQQTNHYRTTEQLVRAEAQAEVRRRSAGTDRLVKGVEAWTASVTGFAFVLTMLGFVAVGAGRFPGMMRGGSIELVLAKPISRTQILLSRYLGGIVLAVGGLLVGEVVLWVGLGCMTGIWPCRIFFALPVTVLSAGLLDAVVVAVAVGTRRTVLAMLSGYAYYLVVDTVMRAVQALDGVGLAGKWLTATASVARSIFPSFWQLRAAASLSVLHFPGFEWRPLGLAIAWIVGLLGLVCLMFRRIDF